MYQQAYRNQEYRNQDVMGASPIRLVVMAYDLAIRACEVNDFERASKAICVLRDALNFDYGESAVGLFRLYQWCLDCIRQNDYESALRTLRELRDAWATVEKRLSSGQSGLGQTSKIAGGYRIVT
jgi:flagellin-specific chaperone FliS